MSFNLANKVIVCAFIAAAIVAAWLMGKRSGARDAYAVASVQLSSVDAQAMITQLQTSLLDTEKKLGEANSALQSGVSLTKNLQRRLDEQMQINSVDQHDLALYRRIENTNIEQRSIDVESILWSASQPETAELTLIQWDGRDFVTGTLNLSVTYEPAPEQDVLSSEKSGEAAAAKNQSLTIDIAPIDFKFRFFQKITIPMPPKFVDAGTGNSIERVPSYFRARVYPSNKWVEPVDIKIPWTDVTE